MCKKITILYVITVGYALYLNKDSIVINKLLKIDSSM